MQDRSWGIGPATRRPMSRPKTSRLAPPAVQKNFERPGFARFAFIRMSRGIPLLGYSLCFELGLHSLIRDRVEDLSEILRNVRRLRIDLLTPHNWQLHWLWGMVCDDNAFKPYQEEQYFSRNWARVPSRNYPTIEVTSGHLLLERLTSSFIIPSPDAWPCRRSPRTPKGLSHLLRRPLLVYIAVKDLILLWISRRFTLVSAASSRLTCHSFSPHFVERWARRVSQFAHRVCAGGCLLSPVTARCGPEGTTLVEWSIIRQRVSVKSHPLKEPIVGSYWNVGRCLPPRPSLPGRHPAPQRRSVRRAALTP